MRVLRSVLFALCGFVALRTHAVSEKQDLFYWEPGESFVAGVRAVIPPKLAEGNHPRSHAELDAESLHLEVERLERLVAVSRATIVIMEREYERGRASADRVKECGRTLDSVVKVAGALTDSVVRQGYGDPQQLQELRGALVRAVDEEKSRLSRFMP